MAGTDWVPKSESEPSESSTKAKTYRPIRTSPSKWRKSKPNTLNYFTKAKLSRVSREA